AARLIGLSLWHPLPNGCLKLLSNARAAGELAQRIKQSSSSQVFARAQAEHHSTARTKRAHGTSRQGPEVSSINLGIDFLQGRSVLADRRKVLLKLLIPGELVLLCNVSSKLGQLVTAQAFHCFL